MSIIIKSKREGFRRCGVPHSAESVEYRDDYWTEEQLEILKAEPMLIVETTKEDLKKYIEGIEITLPDMKDSHAEIDSFAQGYADDYPELQEFIGKGNREGWPKSKKIEFLEAVFDPDKEK